MMELVHHFKKPGISYMAIEFSSVAQSCQTLCNPVNCSMPGFPVHHQLLEFTQKLMSTESVMPPNHLIHCCPLLLLPSIFPIIRKWSYTHVPYQEWSYTQTKKYEIM